MENEKPLLGVICPKCKGNQTVVKDSRPINGGRWRRRACLECGKTFKTMER